MKSESDWLELSRRHVWHPYTQMKTAPPPIPVARAEGVYIETPDGRRILDGISSWWVNVHGHSHPRMNRALAEQERLLTPVFAGPTQLLHADLHMWNTKWVDGDIAVIDFDDAGIGAPLQDLAITTYYVRDRPDVDEAIKQGYEEVRPLPPHTDAEFEALVANRNIMLLNSIMTSSTADMIEFVPEYTTRTVRRMQNWLETGRFEH